MKIRTIILVIFCVVFLAFSCLFFTLSIRSHNYNINIGDSVFFGAYEQDNDLSNGYEPIEWKVISVSDDKAVLLSDKILDFSVFKNMNPSLECNVHWNNSFIRSWLNNEFYNMAFSEKETGYIKESLLEKEENPIDYSRFCDSTYDKVFLLSLSELHEYGFCDEIKFSGNTCEERLLEHSMKKKEISEEVKEGMRCSATAYASNKLGNMYMHDYFTSDGMKSYGWWLRTSGSEKNWVGLIDDEGIVNIEGRLATYPYVGIRPAIKVDLTYGKFAEHSDILKNTEHVNKALQNNSKYLLNILDVNDIDDINQGDTVLFGEYWQETDIFSDKTPIEWSVMYKKEDLICLVSRYVLDYKMFDESGKDVSWVESTIKEWLNNDFKTNSFNEKERQLLYGFIGLPSLEDVLSEEYGYDDDYLEYDINRTAAATDYAFSQYMKDNPENIEYNRVDYPWLPVYYFTRDMLPAFDYWLQDIDGTNNSYAMKVGIKGNVETGFSSSKYGVRPKILLKILQ